ncbi:MAG TPA: cytochrome P450 [Burkholderiales bacterium]|nr:cytochrome P450 [Burkholderiales bacterium]
MGTSAIEFRPEDPAFLADPFPVFARLRDEDPCHWSPRLKSWVLTRYDDVKSVCLGHLMSSDRLSPFFATLPSGAAGRIESLVRYLSPWMVFRDPPDHTRLRRLASKVFTLKAMRAMRPNVEAIAAHLLAEIGERESFDFIAAFAGPLPALVIMDLLGVPRTELARVKRLSDDIALFIGSSRGAAEKYAAAESATKEMTDFFRALIVARRAAPQADVLSELVHVQDAGDRLTEDELIATCILLLFAGHETTTNHIANGLLALMRFPGEMQKLRADPSLAQRAVEELLRYDGPTTAQGRIVQVEHALHGRTLKPADRVFLMLNSANRDPRAYPDPDRVLLERDGVPHLAFGFGLHICLGFPLARLEGEVSLPAVLARFSRIEPAGEPRWLDSLVFRGMTEFPVRVTH